MGRKDWPAEKIWVALDPSPEVVSDACRHNADLLVTHHPLVFEPLKTLDFAMPVAGTIYLAACNHLSILTAHTNLDSAAGGVNDLLAAELDLQNVTVLDERGNARTDGSHPNTGLGRVGDLQRETTLEELGRRLKEKLALPLLRTVGRRNMPVGRVAVCGGSAGGLLARFFFFRCPGFCRW